jgi:hypothetical protein
MSQAYRLFSKTCPKTKDGAEYTLKDFENCLDAICKAKAEYNETAFLSYNYGVCGIAHNLYGIWKNIATAIGQGDTMVIQ